MNAAHHNRIRVAVQARLGAKGERLPTSALGRLLRTTRGAAHAGWLSLSRAHHGQQETAEDDLTRLTAIASAIGHVKGVPMKLGQLLGYINVGLPDAVVAAFSTLHAHAQPLSFARLRAIVESDLGPRGRELAARMQAKPIASASLGQVHRATLADNTRVAVKVLYPGIADTVTRDFGPATLGGRLVSIVFARADLATVIREVRLRIREECDYTLEALRQQRFAELFVEHPCIVVPAVHPAYCGPRVLTTTLVEGQCLDEFLCTEPSAEARRKAGETLFEFYLGPLFRHGVYTCDPHPGNYLFLSDGRMAFFDFGCAHEFSRGFVNALGTLIDATRRGVASEIHTALVELGVVRPSLPYDADALCWLARTLLGPILRDEEGPFNLGTGVRWREIVRHLRRIKGLRPSGEALFLLRTAAGLASVLTRLDARANWFELSQRLRNVQAGPRDTRVRAASEAEGASRRRPLGLENLGPARYDVVLLEPGEGVIQVIREIRSATGRELRDIKDLIDSRPRAVQSAVLLASAEELQRKLESAGAIVEVRPAE